MLCAVCRPITILASVWLVLATCSGQDAPRDAVRDVVHWGRLADVYGQHTCDGRRLPWVHERDVLTAPELPAVAGIRIVRLPCNPDTSAPRVLIDAEIGSAEFERAFAALQASPRELGAELPLDAALRVRWRAGRGADANGPVLLRAADMTSLGTRRIERAGEVLLAPFSGDQAASSGFAAARWPAERLVLQFDPAKPAATRTFVANGALAEPERLFVIGERACQIERAHVRDDGTSMLTLRSEPPFVRVGAGAVLRIELPSAGRVSVDVLADARGADGADLLHVLVRTPADADAAKELATAARSRKVTKLVARYEPEAGDGAATFVRIDTNVDRGKVVDPRAVDPHVGFTLRFSAPIAPASLSGSGAVAVSCEGLQAEVPCRVFAVDLAGTTFRFEPVMGLCCTQQMRAEARADLALPPDQRRAQYRLRVLAGDAGPKSVDGRTLATPIDLPLTIDPDAADNLVGWR